MSTTRELQEMISARENYDTRKVINRADNVTIGADVLEQIEESGITSEQLDALNVPVFRYKTQITLHGIFPALENSGRLGGYKSLFRNGNGSLGIKYNAIDYAKKKRIYRALHECGYSIEKNSMSWRAELLGASRTSDEKTVLQADIDAFKRMKDGIDTNLFFGNVSVNLYRIPFMGLYFAALEIEIGAVYEKNVNAIIENITGKTVTEIDAAINARELAENERNRIEHEKYEIERAERARRASELAEKINAEFTSAGMVKRDFDIPRAGQSDLWYIVYTKADKWIVSAKNVYRVRVVFKKGNSIQSAHSDFDNLSAAIECYTMRAIDKNAARKFKVHEKITGAWIIPQTKQETSGGSVTVSRASENSQVKENNANSANAVTVQVRRNLEKNGIEIVFSDKPSKRIIDLLNASSFNWHKVNGFWYKRYTDNDLTIANYIASQAGA